MAVDKQVIISYHKADRNIVSRLDEDLRKRGITAQIDTRFPSAGNRHWMLKDGIAESEYVIACLSPRYLEDEFCRAQLFLARVYEKRILPILVAPFTPGQSPRVDLFIAGGEYTHAIKGIEELDIADFTGNYPGWGLGSYEQNFERLVDVVQPVPKPTPLNSELLYVSYNYRDTVFALRLARDLQLARGRVWIDKFGIALGSHWRTAMYEGLRAANRFIVCLTPEAARSENVNHEVLVARQRKIPIYSVLSEQVAADPLVQDELETALAQSTEMKFLSDLIPFTPADGYDVMFDRLKKELALVPPEEPTKNGCSFPIVAPTAKPPPVASTNGWSPSSVPIRCSWTLIRFRRARRFRSTTRRGS